MIALGIAQFIVIVLIFFFEMKNRSLAVFLWGALIMVFAAPHMLDCVKGNYDANILDKASLFSFLFCVCYIIARIFQKKEKNNTLLKLANSLDIAPYKKLNTLISNVLLYILAISVFAYFYVVYQQAGSLGAISKVAVHEAGAEMGGLSNILLLCFVISSPVLIYFVAVKDKKKIIIVSILVLLRSFVTMQRSALIVLFTTIVFLLLFNKSKINMKKIITLAIIGIIAMYSFMLIRAFRYYYQFSDIVNISLIDLNSNIFGFIDDGTSDMDLRKGMYFLIENDNDFVGLGTGAGYLRLLLLPFPSSICFGLKPQDICLTIGHILKPGVQGFSFTPTLFGDCYANFGFLGFLLGFIWALIVKYLDSLTNKRYPLLGCLVSCLIATSYVNIARGSIYNAMFYIFYGTVVYIFIYYLFTTYPQKVKK